MKPITLVLVLLAAYLLWRWYQQRRLARLVQAAAPTAIGAVAYGPTVMAVPTAPDAATVTAPYPNVNFADTAGYYWRVPNTYIALR